MNKEYIYFARDFQTSVFPQYMLIDLWNKKYVDYGGMTARLGFANKKKVQEYFIPKQEWAEMQHCVYKKAQTNKNFVNSVKQKALELTQILNEFTAQEIYEKDLSKLSNEQLAEIYNKFYELDQPCYGYGNLVFIFEFGDKALFSNIIKEAIKNKQPDKIQEYYSLLTVPVEQTIFYEQSLDILKISHKICQNKKLNELFLNNSASEISQQLQKNYNSIYKEFERQQSIYHFLFYNWEGPEMLVNDFILFAQDIINVVR